MTEHRNDIPPELARGQEGTMGSTGNTEHAADQAVEAGQQIEQEWWALDGDSVTGDGHPTPEAAAAAYWEEECWDCVCAERPESVEVGRAHHPGHRYFVTGLGGYVADRIAERMSEHCGEFADAEASAVEKAGASLDAELTPLLEAWLKRLHPHFRFFNLVDVRVFPAPPAEAGDQA